MNTIEYIPLHQLSTHYQIDLSFFDELGDVGLIEIQSIEQAPCIHLDQIGNIEKMIRMYQDLHVNIEGIDIAWNLLQKVVALQEELEAVKSRLRLYEN